MVVPSVFFIYNKKSFSFDVSFVERTLFESRLNLVTKKTKVGIVFAIIDLFFLGRLINRDRLLEKNFSSSKNIRTRFMA